MTLLSEDGGGGSLLSGSRYFRILNFVYKRKEVSLKQLNIWESRGFFIVLFIFTHGAILPPSF